MKTNKQVVIDLIKRNWLPNDIGIIKGTLDFEKTDLGRGKEVFTISEVSLPKEFGELYGSNGKKEWLITDREPNKKTLAEITDEETRDLLEFTNVVHGEIIQLLTDASDKKTIEDVLDDVTRWYGEKEAELQRLSEASTEPGTEQRQETDPGSSRR